MTSIGDGISWLRHFHVLWFLAFGRSGRLTRMLDKDSEGPKFQEQLGSHGIDPLLANGREQPVLDFARQWAGAKACSPELRRSSSCSVRSVTSSSKHQGRVAEASDGAPGARVTQTFGLL